MKILCSLGTHTQDFSRMAKAVDELAGRMADVQFFVQTGVTRYDFKNVKVHFDFCPKESMVKLVEETDIDSARWLGRHGRGSGQRQTMCRDSSY